jgi:hypothetical protein
LLRKSDRLLAIADWSRDDKLARREGIKREFGSNSLVAKLGIPRDGTWKVVWKKVVEARLFPSGGGQPPVASSRHDEDRPALIAQILSEIRRALSEGLLSRREAEDLALEVEGASEERLVDLREIIETKGRLK